MNEEIIVSDRDIWVGSEFDNHRIFVLGESWYGDYSDELATDRGYISAYLDGRVIDALYTRISNGVGLDRRTYWNRVMFTNFVQRVGATRADRPTKEHYEAAVPRLQRLLRWRTPRGVWILGVEQSEYSAPVVRDAGLPYEVVVHPASFGVSGARLNGSWTTLLAKLREADRALGR